MAHRVDNPIEKLDLRINDRDVLQTQALDGVSVYDNQEYFKEVNKAFNETRMYADSMDKRAKEIKNCYLKKHTKRDDSAVAYIVLSHAPVIFKLIDQFESKYEKLKKSKQNGFPGYCGSFDVVIKDDEPPAVIQGITAKYMCSMSKK